MWNAVLIGVLAVIMAISAGVLGAEREKAKLCKEIRDGIRNALANGQTYEMESATYNFYASCTEEDFSEPLLNE